MKKAKIISSILGMVGMFMVSIALVLLSENSMTDNISEIEEFDIKNMASAITAVKVDRVSDNTEKNLVEVKMDVAPVSVTRVEVYDNLTIEELSLKIDRNLGSGYVAGKGSLIASYCLQKGVDPYVATAILLHETGCNYNCSYLARVCNNVGGQKGGPSCNGSSYKSYSTLDEGIIGFIDNLANNYYSKGLNTIESIGPKYAASPVWTSKIYYYVDQIRAS